MSQVSPKSDFEQDRILLGLLDSVERDGGQSQRRLASELGIALGLVNAYLKRCVKKGLLKVSQAPARRYVYYLTPHGFAEKSRLTVEYLSFSFGFFRQAKDDFAQLFAEARQRGFESLALIGKSELAEIAAICAIESGVEIVAIIDSNAEEGRFIGLPLVRTLDAVEPKPTAVVITELQRPIEVSEEAIAILGPDHVLVPKLLRVRLSDRQEKHS